MAVRVIVRRSLALSGVAAALSLLLVVVPGVQRAEALAVPPPIVPLLPALGGTVAAGEAGAVTVGAAGAAGTTGVLAIAGVAAFGAGYYGSTAVLNWAFGDGEAPQPGPQPLNGDALYTNANGTTGSWGTGWVKMGQCQSGVLEGFGTGFSLGSATVAGTCWTSSGMRLDMPPYRCKTGGNCTSTPGSIQMMEIGSDGRITTGGASFTFGGFSTATLTCPTGCNVTRGKAVSTSTGWQVFFKPAEVEFSPPPANTLKTTRSCKNLSTGAVTTSSATSAAFYGSESVNVNLAPSVACPAGSTATAVTIDLCGPTGTSCSTVKSWTADTRVIDPQPSDPYRECLPGGSASPCVLKLFKNTTTGWKLCDRYRDCSQYQAATATSSKWRCEWGPFTVPVAQCEPLEDWAATTAPNVATDPDPATEPSTGTGTIPETGTNPETAPATDPNVDPDSQGCLQAGWSWNPVSWVYTPVKCALKWAFVPSSPPSFTDVPSPLPAGWIPTLPGLTNGSCGPVVMPDLDLLMLHTGDRTIVNTCDDPWPLVRSFTYYGLLAGVLVGVGHRVWRMAMVALGMSVESSGGGDDE